MQSPGVHAAAQTPVTALDSKPPRHGPAARLGLCPRTLHVLRRLQAVAALVSRTAQAACLLRLLCQRNVPRLAARLDEASRRRIAGLSLREWVCSGAGEACAATLISTLVADHLSSPGAPLHACKPLVPASLAWFAAPAAWYGVCRGPVQAALLALQLRTAVRICAGFGASCQAAGQGHCADSSAGPAACAQLRACAWAPSRAACPVAAGWGKGARACPACCAHARPHSVGPSAASCQAAAGRGSRACPALQGPSAAACQTAAAWGERACPALQAQSQFAAQGPVQP